LLSSSFSPADGVGNLREKQRFPNKQNEREAGKLFTRTDISDGVLQFQQFPEG